MTAQPDVALTLSGDAALVLDAALADEDNVASRLAGRPESAALLELAAALDLALVATFAADYDEAPEAARLRLADRLGSPGHARQQATRAQLAGADSWVWCFCGAPEPQFSLQVAGSDGAVQELRAHARCFRRLLHPEAPLMPFPSRDAT